MVHKFLEMILLDVEKANANRQNIEERYPINPEDKFQFISADDRHYYMIKGTVKPKIVYDEFTSFLKKHFMDSANDPSPTEQIPRITFQQGYGCILEIGTPGINAKDTYAVAVTKKESYKEIKELPEFDSEKFLMELNDYFITDLWSILNSTNNVDGIDNDFLESYSQELNRIREKLKQDEIYNRGTDNQIIARSKLLALNITVAFEQYYECNVEKQKQNA